MRTILEHILEGHPELTVEQQLRFRAYITAKVIDGEDASAVSWSDVVAAGWDRISDGQCAVLLSNGAVRTATGLILSQGTESPEGTVTGITGLHLHIQLNPDSTQIVTLYLFKGTPGQNTGWVTFA